MLERATIDLCLATLTVKGTLKAGSSKHGNTVLAKFGLKWVATNHLVVLVSGST